ncbi:MAG: hypothetical protein Q9222_001072 [Ikaeria aurantiellina]
MGPYRRHHTDRKDASFLLSPTHEEEITMLVKSAVTSYKQMPLLLYQVCSSSSYKLFNYKAKPGIARKYRDEPRPRQGLLRTREFLMKDLYTFDATSEEAMKTYQQARRAYNAFFDELHIPYIVAEADSGAIGGSLSHEYHIPTRSGEDTIVSCGSCAYAANEELAAGNVAAKRMPRLSEDFAPYQSWFGVSPNRLQLVEAVLPRYDQMRGDTALQQRELRINSHLIKAYYPDLDLGVEEPLRTFVTHWRDRLPSSENLEMKLLPSPELVRIFDYRVPKEAMLEYNTGSNDKQTKSLVQGLLEIVGPKVSNAAVSMDLAGIRDGDKCPRCGNNSGKLQAAVELGHTFYLGDRYSKPMDAKFTASPARKAANEVSIEEIQGQAGAANTDQTNFQMGCHGIGISRIIAAVADALADSQGLIWPRVMAPFEIAILATEEHKVVAEEVWDMLHRSEQGMDSVDAVIDDRDRGLGWKLKDADLIGFPIVVVLGSTFSKRGKCEVSVRRLKSREEVRLEDLRDYILSKLPDL